MNIAPYVFGAVVGIVGGRLIAFLMVSISKWVERPGGNLSKWRQSLVYWWLCAVGLLPLAALTIFHRPYWWIAFCLVAVFLGISGDNLRKHRRAIMIENKDPGG